MSSEAAEPTDSQQILHLKNQIDILCDRFESQWKTGVQPQIALYLEQVPHEHRPLLFSELLLLDWEFCKRDSANFLELYLPQFPSYKQEIERLEVAYRSQETVGVAGQATLREIVSAGTQIGHFQLEERLGVGAVGEVWKAKDLLLERFVTIKFPRHGGLSEAESLRFQREGKAAAQLQHAGIVTVYEVGRHNDLYFIISDYIEGQDLRRWLLSQRPTPSQAAELCAQLADALHHAHQRGIIHRDLKPANVILDRQGVPHLTDFGLAKWVAEEHQLTLEGDLLGTPAYMSPEQARGEITSLDHRSDVYNLGIMLYELLTGSCPFVGDHHSVLNRVINEQPANPRKLVPSIPRDIETICLKALEKHPDRRYPSAQEMAVDLQRFLRGDPIIARRTTAAERCFRWISRRPAVGVVLLLVVITLAALGGMYSFAQQNHELLGLRTVMLRTEPPGAEVAFVPISEQNGEPQLDKILRPHERTPLQVELQPGTYLTVVVLDEIRFHEVFRQVPQKGQSVPGAYDHNRWNIDQRGFVILPTVVIPPAHIQAPMALIDGSVNDSEHKAFEAQIVGRIPPFHLDTTEISLAEYRRVSRGLDPVDTRWKAAEEDWAVTVNYDEATAVAEKLGKRLPTELELTYAKQNVALRPAADSGALPDALGPIGTPSADYYDYSRRIFGLNSNVAEWTLSWPTIPWKTDKERGLLLPFMNGHRIVCCGSALAMSQKGLEVEIATETPLCVPMARVSSGLGFRCARSVRPRIAPQDFGDAILQRRYSPIQVD